MGRAVSVHGIALRVAYESHAGQVDAQGRDYFDHHVQGVYERIADAEVYEGKRVVGARVVAWLHDVVEDTPTTLDDLRDEGLPDEVVNAVDAITRRAGEQYAAYIERVRLNPIARIVKLADNAQNLADNDALAAVDPVKAASLKRRYLAARERLEETS